MSQRAVERPLLPAAVSDFIAGGAASFTSRLILHPVDTLRTRTQVSPSSRLLSNCTTASTARLPLRSLWAGFLASCAGSVPAQSVYYSVYSALKSIVGVAPAAAIANIIAAFVRVPPEVIKQRAQSGIAPSSYAAARLIIRIDGPRGLWRGLGPQILRDVPFAVVMFAMYEWMSSRWERCRGVLGGAIAGITASAVTAPLDLLKTRAMTNVGSRVPLIQEVATILRTEGPNAFWKGSSHRIIYKMGSSAVFFGALEAYKRILHSCPRLCNRKIHVK